MSDQEIRSRVAANPTSVMLQSWKRIILVHAMTLHSEIVEQAQVFQRLLDHRPGIEVIAEEIRRHAPRYAFLAARGTSDNAGRYANYLWGAHNHLPVALATPSLFTYYNSPPNLSGALVVGVSQSGRSPDILAVIREGKRQGCLTLGITNAAGSPLGRACDLVLDVCAGAEKAVAATKSYTAELLAMALLSALLEKSDEHLAALDRLPDWTAQVLELDGPIARMAPRYRFMDRCVVIGRGFNYATAFEWSLKIKELTYTVSEPYSSADFMHGPIAMIERNFPVMVVAPDGKVFEDLFLLMKMLHRHNAELVVISDRSEALALAQSAMAMPRGIPEWLTPLLAIIPAQLFCYHLTLAKGLDPESPRSLKKVTRTH